MAPIGAPGNARSRTLVALETFFHLLPFPFVFLRFWSRRKTRVAYSLNDYLIVVALIFTCGAHVTTTIAIVRGGLGQHMTRVSTSEQTVLELNDLPKTDLVAALIWPPATTFVRFSILNFYAVTFRTHKKTVYASYVVAFLSLCYWIATIAMAFTMCQPLPYNWDKTIPGHCGSSIDYYLSTGIINLLLDVMVVALPLPCVWGLQMRISRKLSLTCIFSLGAIICVLSMVRCYSIATLDYADLTYNFVLDSMLTNLEPTLGVINACLPLLQPVLANISKSRTASSLHSLVSSHWRSSNALRRLRENHGDGKAGKKSPSRPNADGETHHVDVNNRQNLIGVTIDVSVTQDTGQGDSNERSGSGRQPYHQQDSLW